MPEKTRFLSFKNAKICLLCIALHVRILNDLVQLQHVRCPNEVLLLSLVVIEFFKDFSFFFRVTVQFSSLLTYFVTSKGFLS